MVPVIEAPDRPAAAPHAFPITGMARYLHDHGVRSLAIRESAGRMHTAAPAAQANGGHGVVRCVPFGDIDVRCSTCKSCSPRAENARSHVPRTLPSAPPAGAERVYGRVGGRGYEGPQPRGRHQDVRGQGAHGSLPDRDRLFRLPLLLAAARQPASPDRILHRAGASLHRASVAVGGIPASAHHGPSGT
jgi:hypothetical protein